MKIIAHRGYSSCYPESTALAYERALDLPIHGVECDIRLTRDGELVCIHDPLVDRVSTGSGRVSAHTLAQVERLDFGTEEYPQRVLTLDHLLEMIAPGPHHLYIETKHPLRYGRMLEEQLVRRLAYHGLLDDPRIHAMSFAGASIRRMRALAPQIDRIYLRRAWHRLLHPCDPAVGAPTGLGLSIERAREHPGLIGARGLPTYLWTVDEPEDMVWACERGVDMLATNKPELALTYLGGHGQEE
ncbi:glycerophosphodiester phosphodiesterase [Corynebacterium sp. zg-331]|uniref:glycerophosphodiester phosphodiesterase family protein n=1 Tax=unclassified Corynebacterium TaxID=2624378 RepID=UPI0013FFDF1E|nr:glycerophosphodiester phosphodiesterase [Corynebacterium sp. zg-331]MPV53302.1 glycerophosphodiester phosphodiesterase [Corynebacterium sp. zg331]